MSIEYLRHTPISAISGGASRKGLIKYNARQKKHAQAFKQWLERRAMNDTTEANRSKKKGH